MNKIELIVKKKKLVVLGYFQWLWANLVVDVFGNRCYMCVDVFGYKCQMAQLYTLIWAWTARLTVLYLHVLVGDMVRYISFRLSFIILSCLLRG